MDKLSITEWNEADRPREKLRDRGPAALTDAELLGILIGSGTPKETAVDLMKRILRDCDNNLNTLGKMTLPQLMAYKGIGEAKAITIMAACELGKRRAVAEPAKREKMDSAWAVYNYMHAKMQDLDIEEFWILLMNQNYKLIKAEMIGRGGISETAADVRIMMREAILNNATVLAACHNHPSNNPHPSRQDDQLTERIRKACDTMRIYFLDHVVVCDGVYYSYREQGRL